ncbi:MAG: alpha/beta hydrolase [Chloroflexota bacterium]|nr:alpha/beta hydrolase [Chloroflexota bacterium]
MTGRRVVRISIGLLLIVAIAYFGYMGWQGSEELVHPPNPKKACRTPANLGWAYEAINYDRASDDELLAHEDDLAHCSAPGETAGSEVVASDGVRIAGWWIPAAAEIGPDGPTVVMVHGYGDNKSGMLEYAMFLHDRYNLVLFDLRNSGQSTGTLTTQGSQEQRDLVAILDWIVSVKHPAQLIVFGQSMGGHTAVNVVAEDPRVEALILDSTHDRLRTAMVARIGNAGYPFGEVGYLAIALGSWIRSGENVLASDPIDALVRLGSRPVLLLQGGSDHDVPPASADRMAAAAQAAAVELELRVCPGADHGLLDETCPDDYGRWLDDFLERVLASGPPTG